MIRPSLRRFAKLIGRLLSRLRMEMLARIKVNPYAPPPLWTTQLLPWVEALQPVAAQWVDQGGRRTMFRLRLALTRRRARHVRIRRAWAAESRYPASRADVGESAAAVAKASPSPSRLIWDLLHPRVAEATRRLTFSFCDETLRSSRFAVRKAQALLRKELEEGLGEGEALDALVQRVRAIFGTERAYEIARTESGRAVEQGGLLAATESGVVEGKKWLSSPEACPRCLALQAMGTIPLDRPFVVLTKAPPAYQVVMCPTLHPLCTCTVEYVLKEEWRP